MERHGPRWENNIKVEIPKFSARMTVGREKGEVNLNLTQGATLHMVGAAPNILKTKMKGKTQIGKK